MDVNGTTTQIFFTVATDQPAPNAGDHLRTPYMAGSSDLRAVYRNGEPVDQRIIKEYAIKHSILGSAKPTNNGKKAKPENEAAFLVEMKNELIKNKDKSLPERWIDQAFRDNALARFMLFDRNTLGGRIYMDDRLACSDKLLSIGAVPNDDVQKAINDLVERELLQDRFLDATWYEHIWAAAKCPLKEQQVDKLLYSINEQVFRHSICPSELHNNEVYRLRSILMMPGTTLTPNQQHSLNMAYLRVKHEGHARLAKSLRELGGQDDHEELYDKLLTMEKKIEQLAKTLNEMNNKLDEPEPQGSQCTCTIL